MSTISRTPLAYRMRRHEWNARQLRAWEAVRAAQDAWHAVEEAHAPDAVTQVAFGAYKAIEAWAEAEIAAGEEHV